MIKGGGSHVIRVDQEVYEVTLAARLRLERISGRVVTMGDACAFLIALSALGSRPVDRQ